MKKVILASQSPRRINLLKQVGFEFKAEPSSYEEENHLDMAPKDLTEYLSLKKAEDVAEKYKGSIIIGADTIVLIDGEVLGKPKTPENAKRMLEKLSGKAHSVVTGFTIIDAETGKHVSKSIETKVYFKKLSDEEINNYVATGEPLDKAGAYAIQGRAGLFVEKIEGDYFNIVGLPIFALADELKNFGIEIL